METTTDFTMTRGDYIFRNDNSRYQTETRNEAVLRTGFAPPNPLDSFAGSTVAHLEEHTSVAFRIPPTDPATLNSMIGTPGSFTVQSLRTGDFIRPGGYL